MKVKLKSYTKVDNYESGRDPIKTTVFRTIGEALNLSKKIIRIKRSDPDFVGFRIESMEGILKYKLKN